LIIVLLIISEYTDKAILEINETPKLLNRGFGAPQPFRGVGFGDSIAVGNIRFEINDGRGLSGVKVFHLDAVAFDVDNAAGSEADQVGTFGGTAGKNTGQRIARVSAGMNLESVTLLGGVIFMKPEEYPEMRKTLKALQGREVFRINLQIDSVALLVYHAQGV
jgi:hypothetical protein